MVAPRYSTDWEALSLRLVFGALAAIAIVFLVGPTVIMLLTSVLVPVVSAVCSF